MSKQRSLYEPQRVPVPTERSPWPTNGDHVWTCREGFEADLVDELRQKGCDAWVLAPALVLSRGAPAVRDNDGDLVFARQGFAVYTVVQGSSSTEMTAKVTAALREAAQHGPPCPWALHVWVPDSERANPFSRSADTLQRSIEMRAAAIDVHWADRRVATAQAARAQGGFLAQVCLVEPGLAIVGGCAAAQALSLHPGGRARMRVPHQAPSRAAMKLEEALEWIGHGPERGDQCVDLGAAPGGWTFILLERGARVTAVDPGALAPELIKRQGLKYIRGSAFDYEPPEPVDWLFCDMVWRPLEVAALLARWARRRQARFLVANIKLPMRRKVEFLQRIRTILAEGGWKDIRLRHLYHDREEVTVFAHCTW